MTPRPVVVGDFPMLYDSFDKNLALASATGANNFIYLFSVDVDLTCDGECVRGFNYADCRIADYTVKSQRDKEENHFKGFALKHVPCRVQRVLPQQPRL